MQHFVRHFIIIIAVKYIVLLPCGIRVMIIQIMAKPGCAFAAKENESKIKAEWLHILGSHSVFSFVYLSFDLPTSFRQTKNGTYAFDDRATLSLW